MFEESPNSKDELTDKEYFWLTGLSLTHILDISIIG